MSEKKTTDISAMLGTARRAADVPRPQQTEEVAPAPQPEPAKRITLTLDAELHRQLKVQAAQSGVKVMDLTDQAIRQFLGEA